MSLLCSLAGVLSLSSLAALIGVVLAGTGHKFSSFLVWHSVSSAFLCLLCKPTRQKTKKASTCKYTQISGLETVIIFTRQMIIIVGGEPGVHGAMWHAKQEGGLCL